MISLEKAKMKNELKPYGIFLEPQSEEDTNLKYKCTGQERDYSTGLDYMHFRFYASSMGRFLKPDNMIPNAFNPQSWNLYSYVNSNPVNFNDPSGHSGNQPLGQKFARIGLPSGSIWEALAEGKMIWVPDTQGGSTESKPKLLSVTWEVQEVNGEEQWVPAEQHWESTEELVVGAPGHWEFVRGGGGSGGGVETNPYLDINASIGSHLLIGVSLGMQLNKRTEEFHPYVGFGLIFPPGPSASLTASNESSLTEGWNTGLQLQIWPFFAWQWGVAGGEYFYEKGLGFPAGLSITNYYVLPAIRLEPSSPESYKQDTYKPANRKYFSPW